MGRVAAAARRRNARRGASHLARVTQMARAIEKRLPLPRHETGAS